MKYKVVAIRGFWNGSRFCGQSRIEFTEESELEYNEFWKSKLVEFTKGGWIVNVSKAKDEINGKN